MYSNKRNLSGRWDSYWETRVISEAEWTKESVEFFQSWTGSYRLVATSNTHDYRWKGEGRFVTETNFTASFVSVNSGANSKGTGMFITNTEGTYLLGHWYGFSGDSSLVAAGWLFVREGRDPKPVVEKFYGADMLDAFCRSAETKFTTPIQRKVFISYRRSDSMQTANSLQRALGDIFGDENVFTDLQRILPGSDFLKEIQEEIRTCDTVLVLIGPTWLTAVDSLGSRLNDINDVVRLEVVAALKLGIPVVPILIDDASTRRIA